MAVLQALRTKWTPIGVDIGAAGVRAVQARATDKGYVIVHAAQCDRPPSEKEAPAEQTQRLIADCLHKIRFHGRAAIAAIMPPEAQFHSLDLPAAALKTDADQVVRFEVERLMTDPPPNFETRHWPLPPTSAPAPNTLAVGASHEHIRRGVEECSAAGLVCSCVDTAATALVRLGSLLRTWPEKVVWGMLDLGERSGRLVLSVDNVPVLVRTTGTGGRIWTQRIADALQVSFKAAEVHKRTHGIALASRSRASDVEPARSELASMLLGALRLELNDLTVEVKRSYEYVLGCYPNRKAADLIMVGGGAGMRNLPEYLSQALGIPVRRASEYLKETSCRIAVSQAGLGPEPLSALAVAAGLVVAE
jgi:Tfp pilus assembly PilM family ATPase